MKSSKALLIAAALALLGCGPTFDSTGEDVGVAAERLVDVVGITTLRNAGPGEGDGGDVVTITAPGFDRTAPGRASSAAPPSPAPKPIAAANPGLFGFNGLTNLEQRRAGTGRYRNTQVNLEPPDNALCVGNGFVLQAVNVALAVRDTNGRHLVPPTALTQFFGLPPLIDSETHTFGAYVTDPRCLFDAATDRWFLTAAENDLDPVTGAFGPRSHLELAVSRSGDPTGDWTIYSIDVSSHGADCPCIGDQPLIGADAFGFYLSTNAFSLLGPMSFQGAQIYALPKAALVAGVAPKVVHIDSIPVGSGEGGSIQPAIVPPGGAFELRSGGTEYFMSSLVTGGIEDRIAVWALTNTSSLDRPATSLRLSRRLVPSEPYGQPPPALQKAGPRPLSFVCDQGLLERLLTDDDRMQQVMFAGGALWSALTTVVGPSERAGVAYFAVAPLLSDHGLRAAVVQQGYVALGDTDSVFYPAVGMSPSGRGAIAFTISGPHFFPSAGFALLDAQSGAGAVHVARAGAAPEDGLTGYPGAPCNGTDGLARWGDYSAAAVAEDGAIWSSTEYIPAEPRDLRANWGTFIARLRP